MPAPYLLDITATNPNNLITNELHITNETVIDGKKIIVLEYTPFFINDFSITLHDTVDTVLTQGTHYSFGLLYLNGLRQTNNALYGCIFLNNVDDTKTISITYRTLGGSKLPNRIDILNRLIDNKYREKLSILDVYTTDLPLNTITPTFNNYPLTKGELEVTNALYNIAEKIAQGYYNISASIKDKLNPTLTNTNNFIDFNIYLKNKNITVNNEFIVDLNDITNNTVVTKEIADNVFNTIENTLTTINNDLNNKLSKVTPVATGPIYVTNIDVNNASSVVNKFYVDSILQSPPTENISVGSILTNAGDTTPDGYLRCNGAIVSKTTYSDLYNAIGDSFTDITYTTITKPWENQYEFTFIPTQDLSIITSYMVSLPYETSNIGVFATRNKIYLVGGYSTTDPSGVINHLNKVYSYKLDENSNLIDFNTESNFPVYGYDISCDIVHNRVYAFAPYSHDSSSNLLPSSIYSSQIDNKGNILSWQLETTINVLDVNNDLLYATSSVIIGNKYYVAGFYNESFTTNYCYVSTINIDGTLSPFTQTTPLPNGLTSFKFVVIKNKLYLIGGSDATYNYNYNIYSCDINSDFTLGTWTTVLSLVADLYIPTVYVTHNTLYIFSIVSGNKKMYMANINSDGTLNNFIEKNIEFDLGYTSLCATKNYIYLFGSYGFDNNINSYVATSNIYVIPINTQYNDYHQFYQLQHQTLPPGYFQLPNLNYFNKNNLNYFIKY